MLFRSLHLGINLCTDSDSYSWKMRVAENDNFYTELVYRVRENTLTIDRRHSGSRRALRHIQECEILKKSSELSLEVVLDKNSLEVFVNGGEQTMTVAIYTPLEADGISFLADGKIQMDIEKSNLTF